MQDNEQIIVGLEVGTSKVCAVVGEISREGGLMIIGVGQAESAGVRKGEIVDVEKATQSVHAALADAEKTTDVEIHNVYVAITGGHLRSFGNRGTVAISSDDREITPAEVRNALLNAKAVNIPPDHVVIHAIRQHFFVDGHDGIENPVGMVGARLDADVHIIHGMRSRIVNTINCVKRVPLDVANICVSSFASALAVLTDEDRRLGAVLIDIGGGITDYIVYRDGAVVHSGALAVGGDHITNDIAVGLKLPINRAEQLKVEYGSLDVADQDEVITLKREVGLPDRTVSRQQLCEIMRLRVEEILSLIKKELVTHQLLPYMGNGVFLTGGCARLRGLEALATEVFGLPVRLQGSQTVSGPTSALESPEYSTAIGLVRYAMLTERDQHRSPTVMQRMGQTWHHIIQRVRAFLCI